MGSAKAAKSKKGANKSSVKATPKKASAKKATPKKASAKKATPKKASAKKTTPKKASAKKTTPKKASAKKTTPKKASAKKATPKKASIKKATPKKPSAKKAPEVREVVAQEPVRGPLTADEPRLPSTCSGGGPVIAVPAELAEAWRGTLPPLDAVVPKGWTWGGRGGPRCDYDRICEHGVFEVRTDEGGVGLLSVGSGHAIALDAEIVTSWISTEDGGAILRTGSALREEEGRALLERAAAAQATEATRAKRLASTLSLADGRIFLFDSAYAGAADPTSIRSFDGVAVGAPGPGTYAVEVTMLGSHDVIRLRRV